MTDNFFLKELQSLRSTNHYIESLGIEPYEWQKLVLDDQAKRIILCCSRQSGKSTVTAGIACHVARSYPGSLSLLCAPSLQQSEELMKKLEDFAELDKDLRFEKASTMSKQLENRARVVALPGTQRSVRGYSGPRIILLDEASRIIDETYSAIRPMLTGQESAKLILMSTPNGKTGFFYHEWSRSDKFIKVLVKPRYKLNEEGTEIVEDLPEDEFKDMWKEKGVNAFYSPRHTKEWLEEELASLGPVYYRQEYDLSFVDGTTQLFSERQIDSIFDGTGEDELLFDHGLMEDSEVFSFGGYQ